MSVTQNKIKHLNIALEAIAFQGNGFHKELTIAIESYIGKTHTTNELTKLENLLEKIIKKRTNAIIKFNLNNEYLMTPFIVMYEIDHNNLLSSYGEVKEEFEDISGWKSYWENNKQKAGVDLNTSKVRGLFTDWPAVIFIKTSYFTNGNFTAGELAAVILHEVGHFLVMCEMIDRTCGTNQILSSIDRMLKHNTDVSKRDVILQYGGEALGLDQRVISNAKESSDDKISSTIYLTESINSLQYRTDQNNKYYEQVSPEYLSDEFAARHGAGKDLVSFIDKVNPYALQKRDTRRHLTIEAGKIAFILGGLLASNFLGILVTGSTLMFSVLDRSDLSEPVYDNPLQRLTRIRNQYIEQSKIPNISKEMAKSILEDIKVVDKILSEYSDKKDFITFLMDAVSTKKQNRDYQRQLEKLVMNDLFLKALQFKN